LEDDDFDAPSKKYQNNFGKVVFGVFSGVFAFLIMGCGTSPIGAMFVILITNIISPIIQLVEDLIYQKILRVKGNKDDREN
jgi:Na+-translocating ferredoxin:NAD+ oxidoreductase RnfD subunit